MLVYVRSNDAIWGFSHNDFFLWSLLQQMMAFWTNSNVGKLVWNVGSFHIYERHYKMAKDIASYDIFSERYLYNYASILKFNTQFDYIDKELSELFYNIDILSKAKSIPLDDICEDPMLDIMGKMLIIYNMYKNDPRDSAYISMQVNKLPNCDFKFAAIEYLCRDSLYVLDMFDCYFPTNVKLILQNIQYMQLTK